MVADDYLFHDVGIRNSKEVSVTTAVSPDDYYDEEKDDKDAVDGMVREGHIKTTVEGGSQDYQQKLQYGPKVRRLSNSSSIISDIFNPDLSEDRLKRRIKEANDRPSPKDLIDFLRNTTPPPGNYMSIPEKYDSSSPSSDDGKLWRPLRVFRRKSKLKQKKKAKQQQRKCPVEIKLPDSAVAGRTIGGHRHIAISIPVEYAHLEADAEELAENEEEDSEEAIIRTGTVPSKVVETRSGPVRVNSDRGLVTVLRPVAEGRESIDNMLQQPPMADIHRRPHTANANLGMPPSPRSPDKLMTGTDDGSEGADQVPFITFTRGSDNDEMARRGRPRTADGFGATSVSGRSGPHLSIWNHPGTNSKGTGSSGFTSFSGGSQSRSASQNQMQSTTATARMNTLPQRRSSLGNTTHTSHTHSYSGSSFDHVPSTLESGEGFLMRRGHRRGLSSIDSNFGTRASIADSIATDGTEPVIVDASTARAYVAPAVVALEVPRGDGESANRLSVVTNPETVVFSPLSADVEEKRRSAASMPEIAMLMPRGQQSLHPDSAYGLRSREEEVAALINGAEVSSKPQGSAGQMHAGTHHDADGLPGIVPALSLAPITTVADTQPYIPPPSPTKSHPSDSTPTPVTVVQDPLSPPLTIHQNAPSPLRRAFSPPRRTYSARNPPRLRIVSEPMQRQHSSPPLSNPQSPVSPLGGPPPAQTLPRQFSLTSKPTNPSASLDRVSLSRRRERAAQKAQDRLAREDEVRYLKDELARRNSTLKRSASHAELARRYEAVRTAREQELKGRLARLERNGEAWLKLFERLNASLVAAGGGGGDGSDGRRGGVGGRTYGLGWRQPSWEELSTREILQGYRDRQEQERQRYRAQPERVRLDRMREEDGSRRWRRDYLAREEDEDEGESQQPQNGTGGYQSHRHHDRNDHLTLPTRDNRSRSPAAPIPRERAWRPSFEDQRFEMRSASDPTSDTIVDNPAIRPRLFHSATAAATNVRDPWPSDTSRAVSLPSNQHRQSYMHHAQQQGQQHLPQSRGRTVHSHAHGLNNHHHSLPRHGESPSPSRLQEDFETELARRRGVEALEAEIDACMVETPVAALRYYSSRGGLLDPDFESDDYGRLGADDTRGPSVSGRRDAARGSVDLGGYVDDVYNARNGGSVSGLDTLEPLMRELMGAARFEGGVAKGGIGDVGEPRGEDEESILSEEAEYLFEQF